MVHNIIPKTEDTGDPPLMQISLPRIPVPRFLAYVRTSGGFLRLRNAFFSSPKIRVPNLFAFYSV